MSNLRLGLHVVELLELRGEADLLMYLYCIVLSSARLIHTTYVQRAALSIFQLLHVYNVQVLAKNYINMVIVYMVNFSALIALIS